MSKIKLLLLTIFIFGEYNGYCQNPIIQPSNSVSGSSGSSFSIDVNSTVTGLPPLITPGEVRQRGVKKTLPFIEFGDGAFSTAAVTQHTLGKQNNEILLFAAPIYDTTRPKAATMMASLGITVSTGNYSTNNPPILDANDNIMLASNVSDIVQGDYTNFVLTYKLPDTEPVQENKYKYRIVVLYNNNPVFNPINTTDKLPNGADRIRLFYYDQLTADPINKDMLSKIKQTIKIDFKQSFSVDCGDITSTERNLFFTTYTDPNVELNNVTSIYAILLKSPQKDDTWTKVDDYLINSMPVALAHDPNYIAQTGRCILLPKKEKTIKYHVHFQNDGRGEAGRVDIKIKLPPGINNGNIKFGSANCGGNIFELKKENTVFDQENYTLEISFMKGERKYLLKGTDNNLNPSINPNTMGDIFFNVSERVITCDTLPAYADIFFYSLGSDKPLPPVRTNLAASVYKEQCDGSNIVVNCDTTKIWHKGEPGQNRDHCYTLLSICWYWWLLLIFALWIAYQLYRRNKANSDIQSGT
jgi:hypothetical protein